MMNRYDRSRHTTKPAGTGTAPIFFEDIINSRVCKGRRGGPAQGYNDTIQRANEEEIIKPGRMIKKEAAGSLPLLLPHFISFIYFWNRTPEVRTMPSAASFGVLPRLVPWHFYVGVDFAPRADPKSFYSAADLLNMDALHASNAFRRSISSQPSRLP